VALIIAATAAPARSLPQDDLAWLQGRWSCDEGGYAGPAWVDVLAQPIGPSAIAVSWKSQGQQPRYVLRRGADGKWTLRGRTNTTSNRDVVIWDLVESAASSGDDVTFKGASHQINAGRRMEIGIEWEFIRTGDGEYAEWQTLTKGGQSQKHSRHCHRTG